MSEFSTNNLLYDISQKWLKIDGYICSESFYKHRILFPTVWHLSRLSQGRTQGRPKCAKKVLKWRTFELMGWITGKRLKTDGCCDAFDNHWILFPSMWHLPRFSQGRPRGAKMCLRLSWRSQMPPPAKRVKATTYLRDSPVVAKLWLRLVFMQLTRDLFAIAKFLLIYGQIYTAETTFTGARKVHVYRN